MNVIKLKKDLLTKYDEYYFLPFEINGFNCLLETQESEVFTIGSVWMSEYEGFYRPSGQLKGSTAYFEEELLIIELRETK
jgi:hypothetical protein